MRFWFFRGTYVHSVQHTPYFCQRMPHALHNLCPCGPSRHMGVLCAVRTGAAFPREGRQELTWRHSRERQKRTNSLHRGTHTTYTPSGRGYSRHALAARTLAPLPLDQRRAGLGYRRSLAESRRGRRLCRCIGTLRSTPGRPGRCVCRTPGRRPGRLVRRLYFRRSLGALRSTPSRQGRCFRRRSLGAGGLAVIRPSTVVATFSCLTYGA